MDEMTVFSRWIDAVSARSDAPGAPSVRVDRERNRGDAKRSTTVCEPGGPSTVIRRTLASNSISMLGLRLTIRNCRLVPFWYGAMIIFSLKPILAEGLEIRPNSRPVATAKPISPTMASNAARPLALVVRGARLP